MKDDFDNMGTTMVPMTSMELKTAGMILHGSETGWQSALANILNKGHSTIRRWYAYPENMPLSTVQHLRILVKNKRFEHLEGKNSYHVEKNKITNVEMEKSVNRIMKLLKVDRKETIDIQKTLDTIEIKDLTKEQKDYLLSWCMNKISEIVHDSKI